MNKFPAVCSSYIFAFLVFGISAIGVASVQDQLDAETARRQRAMEPLQKVFAQGRAVAKDGDWDRACALVTKAWEETPEGFRATTKGREVANALAYWYGQSANLASQNGRWPVARQKALLALQYNPQEETAHQVLQQSLEILGRGATHGQSVNPALTSSFFDRLGLVKRGLTEAEDLRQTGQLDLAEKKYEEVLTADPFNRVATEGIRKIYQERALVADQSRELANLQQKREVRESWNNILPREDRQQGGIVAASPMSASPAFLLQQKLKATVIPQIDFNGADLETIRRALSTLSRQYDPEAAKAGVNFIVSSDLDQAQPVTLRLRQVTLAEVIRYVAQIAGVRVRISDIGVTFSPSVEKTPDLISRSYTVSPSFFRSSSPAGEAGGGGSPRGAALADAGESEATGLSAQAKLQDLKVNFPPGASAVYNPNTSQLKVVNNAEMLDLIGQLIAAAEEETLLIQVGVRLVEINQTDLDSITANSTMAGTALPVIPAGLTTNNQGPLPFTGSGWSAQLNQIQGVGLLPNNTLQSFLQNGVLAGTNQTSSYALNTLELGGTIMNGAQFRTLITAISQKSSANVLASPSIVLKRGQEGVIEVTQEFRYVQEYNDPQSSIRTFNPVQQTDLFGVVASSVPGPETVISSFPSQTSDPVPIGVKMGVKPDVTGDNSRVLMTLRPSFIDFEGFINYGTQINSAFAATYYSDQVTILTNNIQQPVFVRRDLELPAVEVNDGYTLLLGGLLREDIQSIDEKVPLIGDLPILGRAFQGKTEQAIKKNTLIFTTPRILRVDGQPLNPTAGSPTTAAASGPP